MRIRNRKPAEKHNLKALGPADSGVENYSFYNKAHMDEDTSHFVPKDGWDFPIPKQGDLRPLTGFGLCEHLDGSIFDTSVEIKTSTLMEVSKLHGRNDIYDTEYVFAHRLKNETLTEMIDSIATIYKEEIYGLLRFRKSDATPADPLRLACFMAADGENLYGKYTKGKRKFLRFIDKHVYFNELDFYPSQHKYPVNMKAVEYEAKEMALGAEWRKKTTFVLKPQNGEAMKSKIAYLIQAHDHLDRIKSIVELLKSDKSLILIHVDGRSQELKDELIDWIEENQWTDIRVMEKSYTVTWGDFSMVLVELAGFFELLDWSDEWEYVSNISGDDLPLKTPEEMIDIFATYPVGTSLIGFHEDEENDFMDIQRRLNGYMHVRRKSLKNFHEFAGGIKPVKFRRVASGDAQKLKVVKTLESKHFGVISFPFKDWKLHKQHQWMSLHRSFIQYIRESPTAAYLMAVMEFTVIPDEHYFALLAANSRPFMNSFQTEALRKIVFSGWHPITWRSRSRRDKRFMMKARREKGLLFVRKVQLENEWHSSGLIRTVFPEKWPTLYKNHQPKQA